ncbi:MAG: hypothetical protein IKL79_01135 [Clostridia bacterium]|nr:hypothetical protein [Clostridia bacterium]
MEHAKTPVCGEEKKFTVVYDEGISDSCATIFEAKNKALINFKHVKAILSEGEVVYNHFYLTLSGRAVFALEYSYIQGG